MSNVVYSNISCLKHYCQWQADNALVQHLLPEALVPWLGGTGSLTQALRVIADGTFKVSVLSEQIKVPFWHEQRKLQRSLHLAALIREVELSIHERPVVFARSIIPLNLVSAGRGGLKNLGGTPLGHLLFKDGNMRVSKREFLRLQINQKTIHARRTPYDYLDSRILVSEFFLPEFNKYL
ncbi:MAG: chorismate--pyruvate lyase [Cryomorphaceae bacterium]|jgi:chorismate--pyruvate lyase